MLRRAGIIHMYFHTVDSLSYQFKRTVSEYLHMANPCGIFYKILIYTKQNLANHVEKVFSHFSPYWKNFTNSSVMETTFVSLHLPLWAFVSLSLSLKPNSIRSVCFSRVYSCYDSTKH